jgi:biopolymer transport protein ExbD
MAELTQNGAANSGGKVRTKKHSTKIDMTPMVDLAFLLLTFFILTTTLNKSPILELSMPSGDPSPVNAENVLNIALATNDKIYWWKGLEPKAERTDYSKDGIRKLLLAQSQANAKLIVIIKPMDNAKYENLVDILDEMVITGTTRYSITDFTDDDRTRIVL